MTVENLPIFTYYDQQRFTQFGAMDAANWYATQAPSGKKKQALFPTMGRQHVHFFHQNRLIYSTQPRFIFRSISFIYVIVGSSVFQYDQFFNQKLVGFIHNTGDVWFDYLPVDTTVYCMLTSNNQIYVITEQGTNVTFTEVTDGNRPANAVFVATFGNRFVVSNKNSPNFYLSTINLAGDASNWFSFGAITPVPLVARASGIIGQFAVLHNQLYIMCDFVTDIWSNIPTNIVVGDVVTQFPWKLNTSYNFDFGIQDPHSLSVDFGMMVWLAKNRNGLVTFMSSDGQRPKAISTQAINVLVQNSREDEGLSPFLAGNSDGFLYQYEDSIFYRVSAGNYMDFGQLDVDDSSNCIEFHFDTETWHRCIELNGERNRIKQHVFFNNRHLVTVEQDTAIYEMAGNIYHNELRNPGTLPQADDAFLKFPFRYELTTPQIFEEDYSEFLTSYVEIDFVFGYKTFYKSSAPFENTVFVIDETAATDGSPLYVVSEDDKFLITEGSNTPTFDDNHYDALFKPHVELYWSDDGGVTFSSADLREFSNLGMYRWRMRWYELGCSRNRCYKLVGVSSAPIVILGAVQNKRRVSGGAN